MKRQTASSRSTTEAETVSLAYSLFHEAIPALTFWCKIVERDVTIVVWEDNQANIKVIQKDFSTRLRHISRTHKVDLGSVKEVIDHDTVELRYCESAKQCADIFTKQLQPNKWDNALSLLGISKGEQDNVLERTPNHSLSVACHAPSVACPAPTNSPCRGIH